MSETFGIWLVYASLPHAFSPPFRGPMPACSHSCSHWSLEIEKRLEAPPGFEPGVEVLQTSALPLGDGALIGERLTRRCLRHRHACTRVDGALVRR